jgi:hypothetical protein
MRNKKRLSFLGAVLLGLCLVVPAGGAWADGCEASLDSTLMKEEKEEKTVTYKFKVDVSSPERCADVDYVLKVVEAVPGEKSRPKESSHHTRVRDGVKVSAKVDYKMPSNHQLVGWKFEVVGCEPCGAAKSD